MSFDTLALCAAATAAALGAIGLAVWCWRDARRIEANTNLLIGEQQ